MSKLRNQPDDAASGCWVDLYSSSYFGGRLKRIYGPNYIRVGGTGSLIVGPEASILRAGRNPGVNLRPKTNHSRPQYHRLEGETQVTQSSSHDQRTYRKKIPIYFLP